MAHFKHLKASYVNYSKFYYWVCKNKSGYLAAFVSPKFNKYILKPIFYTCRNRKIENVVFTIHTI
jgi:hypothetical protein